MALLPAIIFLSGCDHEKSSSPSSAEDRQPKFDRTHSKPPAPIDPETTLTEEDTERPEKHDYSEEELEFLKSTIDEISATRVLLDADDSQIASFRENILEVSRINGLPLSRVFSDILRMRPEISDGMCISLRKMFLSSPGELAEGFVHGLDGRKRHFAIAGLANKLRDAGDLDGLRKVYQVVPPGSARGNVATALVLEVAEQQGLEEARKQMNELEYPEERSLVRSHLGRHESAPRR